MGFHRVNYTIFFFFFVGFRGRFPPRGSLAAEGDGIGAVLAALERHRLHLADELEAGMPRKERRGLAGVLLRLVRAGGVNDRPAEREPRHRRVEDLRLELRERGKPLLAPVPARVGAAPEDPGVGAGGVDEDLAEQSGGGWRGLGDDLDVEPQTRGVLLQLAAAGGSCTIKSPSA